MERPKQTRKDAFSQLKKAQRMIEQGRAELAAAHEKISAAQELIDQSAEDLRNTPPDKPMVSRRQTRRA